MAKNNNTTLETTIGQLCAYYGTVLCTVKDLKEELARGGFCYRPQHYCDFRYTTNLQRFVYDPYIESKIDWKEVKRLLTND